MPIIRNTLGFKIVFCYILLFISGFSFLHFYGSSIIRNSVMNETHDMLKETGTVILQQHIDQEHYNEATIKSFESHIVVGAEAAKCRIMIVNMDGEILIDSDQQSQGKNVYSFDSDILHNTELNNVTLGDIITRPSITYTIPIANRAYLKGYIILSATMQYLDERASYYVNILDALFYTIMGVLVVVFFIIYIINTIPLRKLIRGAKGFSIRKQNPTIHIHSNDEYRDLAATLNVIGEEMSKFDEYQKRFIANISHDFRSPLTSIRGYAEALKDGTIPYENQEKYLDVILFETHRLNDLTSNLLQLNTFDKMDMVLDISTFDIHECIKKTADSLEGVALKKHIRFYLMFDLGESLLVKGDEGKIQQVLHNLMDNAIKFSGDHSQIEFRSKRRGERVYISVKDFGIGIPKGSISKVWERFYKTDLSRGKDKKGTGLGLCICKEIITAHGQKIDVVSTEGVGSEFTFTLEKA